MTELEQILNASTAADAFKAAVKMYCSGQPADRIRVDGYAPPVKVIRLLTHLLASEPELVIEQISARARSGCSDFSGRITVATADESRTFEFVWDCRWRAEREGWTDYFGFPDQARAARVFDWRCFERWEVVASTGALVGASDRF